MSFSRKHALESHLKLCSYAPEPEDSGGLDESGWKRKRRKLAQPAHHQHHQGAEDSEEFDEEEQKRAQKKVPKEGEVFACGRARCSKRYSTWNELSQHIKVCGALPCPCGYVISRCSDFYKHQKACKLFVDVTPQERAALFDAAAQGNVEALSPMLDQRGFLINILHEQTGNTLLHVACLHNQVAIIQRLAEEEALMPNLTNKDGKTAVYLACEFGLTEALNVMMSSLPATLNVTIGSQHFSPLMIACKNGQTEIVRSFLNFQGDIPVTNRVYYGSPLSYACDSGKIEILDLLLSLPKTDVNEKLHLGGTVLHHACINNQKEAFRRLLQMPDIDVNAQTDLGCTPLMTACQNKKYSIAMELLKDPRLDPNIADARGRTPLWMAAVGDSPSIFNGILVLSPGVVDTTTTPENLPYPPKFKKLLEEYRKNRTNFKKKYGKDLIEGGEGGHHRTSRREGSESVEPPDLSAADDGGDPTKGRGRPRGSRNRIRDPAVFLGSDGIGSETPTISPADSMPVSEAESELELSDSEPELGSRTDVNHLPGDAAEPGSFPSPPSSILPLLLVVENLRRDDFKTATVPH